MKKIELVSKLKNLINQDTHFKEVLKGSVLTFVIKICGMFMGYLLLYLISNKLGAEGVGYYNLMFQILTVLGMILCLGMNNSVLRYVGQFNNVENQSKMHLLDYYVLIVVGPITLLFGALLFFWADLISDYLCKNQEFAEGLKYIGFILPFFTINHISVEFIRGLKKLQISELVRSVLRPLFMIIGVVFFFYDDLSKIDLIYLLVCSLVLNSVISRITILLSLRRINKQNIGGFRIRQFMQTSLPMMSGNIASAILVAMPIFFLDLFSSEAAIGIFSIAFRLATLVALVLVVINTIAGPKYAELYWGNKPRELQRVIKQVSGLMFWMALFLCITLIAGAKFWLGFFGEEFTSGNIALIILVIGQFVNAVTGSVGIFLNMSGHEKVFRKVLLYNVLIAIIGYSILIPKFDIIGASLVNMTVAVVSNLFLAFYVYKYLKIRTFYLPFLTR